VNVAAVRSSTRSNALNSIAIAEKQKDTQRTHADFQGQQRPDQFYQLRRQALERHGEHTKGEHGADKSRSTFDCEQEAFAGFPIHPGHIGTSIQGI
jgi:hypothetical protein